eukprot:Em0001g462a
MHRAITAKTEVVHHRCSVKLFQWEMHSDQECKVCKQFEVSGRGTLRRHTAGRGRLPGATPNMLIKYLKEIAPTPVFEHHPPVSSQNNPSILEQLTCQKAKVAKGIATVQKGFSEKEGPFVKQLDSALQLIGVQRQQYFGGAFVGNQVHKALKLPNVKTLCTAISQMAQEKLPHRSGEVAENMKNFINLFSLFGKCHNISDQNFIDEPQIHALDQAIEEFMAFFQQQQSQSKCT